MYCFCMKAEELARSDVVPEDLNFDAHEFDGLRDDLAAAAETWLKRVDRFVQENPWVCIGIAAAAGCALACALRKSGQASESTDSTEPS
jgi:ElaB/YqjD/DUF883 family membrane-anchored ribosome-binding protein